MHSRWNDSDAARCSNELALNAYGSRLLGGDACLVLHGGGNTSIKLDGPARRMLYVKATGSDLATVTEQDFTPLWLDDVLALLARALPDNAHMYDALAHCLAQRGAPRPSIETLMHAALPFRCVQHTHADAVLAALNVDEIDAVHAQVYGELAPLVPYHHSGHALAHACQAVYRAKATPCSIGLILAFHGVVAFGDDAKSAYHNMIALVSRAEDFLRRHGAPPIQLAPASLDDTLPATLRTIHARLNQAAGRTLAVCVIRDAATLAFARREDLADITHEGPATPQHTVYTRRVPLIDGDIDGYSARYRAYLESRLGAVASAAMDTTPRIVLDAQAGLCAFGDTPEHARIAARMYYHDIGVIAGASTHGRYRAAPPAALALAEFEYGGYAARLTERAS